MEQHGKTRLIIEGNSMYEVDEECMKRGLNRQTMEQNSDSEQRMKEIRRTNEKRR